MNLIIKRLFDLLSSLLLSIILIPILAIVAIAIKLDSKGPVLFIQKRRTLNGKVFDMFKFRTMVVNAENMDTGIFSFKNDSRITRVGKFLRNTSIDELPQLINIIKGDMSVVGPRPCVENELGDFDTLNNKYKKRFKMKAGLTGLAQVKYRNDITWDKKVEIDNEYIDLFNSKGLLIDAKVLFMSIIRVFKKNDIVEEKIDSTLNDKTAAELAEKEIIRIAHLPD